MKTNDNFLHPSARPRNIDRYIPREAILKFILNSQEHLKGRCLDVGCGEMPYRSLLLSESFKISELIGIDRAGERKQTTRPDLEFDGDRIPLPDSTIDSALCTEVLEHCPDPVTLLLEVRRVLKTNGTLMLTIPFLWPLHEIPHDWARYTPFALSSQLERAGFRVIEMRALGGYDKSLAQMLGLWLRRRPMNRFIRGILTLFIYPFWTLLRMSRENVSDNFSEGVMITGLMARAEKA
jgi:SAM-dependent methyltransferase